MKLVRSNIRSSGADVLSVSELTRSIKASLEKEIGTVTVSGEMSNVHRHTSGHLYFTLKDANSQLTSVMFRTAARSVYFTPENGMEVVCSGSISVYEPRGQYQLIVSDMQPRGAGALQASFEKLRLKLFEEGLFDEAHKSPLPPYPRRIALVTSPTGAAIRDLISVIRRRNPTIELIIVPVQVQGAGAAEQIAQGIRRCNEFGDIDIICTGRGGGSIEDLWAFNEEIVARTIFASVIPVVSAVGHEVDVTIADYVADLRAATPSVAGELVAPTRAEIKQALAQSGDVLRKFVDFTLESNAETLFEIAQHRALTRPESVIRTLQQNVDAGYDRLLRAVDRQELRLDHTLQLYREQLRRHDPSVLLNKGAAIVMHDGVVVSSIGQVRNGDELQVQVRDGSIHTTVKETHRNG